MNIKLRKRIIDNGYHLIADEGIYYEKWLPSMRGFRHARFHLKIDNEGKKSETLRLHIDIYRKTGKYKNVPIEIALQSHKFRMNHKTVHSNKLIDEELKKLQ